MTLLLVVHDRGSATPLSILPACRGRCDVAFVADLSSPRAAAGLRLPRSATVIDTSGLSATQVVERTAALAPAGVVTFSDYQLRQAAAIAQACGLPFHTPGTAELLTDKLLQRRAFADAGMRPVASCVLASAGDIATAAAAVRFPAVLKPRHGAGSVDTCLVRSEADLTGTYARLAADASSPREYVLEEYLPADRSALGDFWGDYVSVESVVADGVIHPVAITGKLPMAPPFRETGMIVPAEISPAQAQAVLAAEHAGLRALGVRHAVTHTEIKFTPDGPQVIEVNGRMGGHVADLIRRSGGPDLVTLAIRLALGERPYPVPGEGEEAAGPRRVAFSYFLAAPADDVLPGRPDVLERLSDIPNVQVVDARANPSWRPNWREGTEWLIGKVHGVAPDHQGARAAIKAITDCLADFWLPADHPRASQPVA